MEDKDKDPWGSLFALFLVGLAMVIIFFGLALLDRMIP